jgi:cytoskeletal protein RodZ
VSIGATLAAARRRAGLSVGEVSQRTRVQEDVIQGIEHDDYAACGDDLRARDHIRAIAGAVGTDAAPLIEEFDDTWGSAPPDAAPPDAAPQARPPVIEMPARTRERRRVRWTSALAVLVLAVLGFAVYKAVSGSGPAPRPSANASPPPAAGGQTAPASAGVQGSPAPVTSAPVTSDTASAAPSASPSAPAQSPSARPAAPSVLAVAKTSAFGPGGGDHPEQAALAVSGNPATAWHTKWYATADFGMLYSGTGLLIDLGHPVTVTSVRLSLGIPGAALQLRAGDRPVAASLRTVATSARAGSTVQLALSSPPQARYLLVWFTKLPPDGAGHYQDSIYQVVVRGQR